MASRRLASWAIGLLAVVAGAEPGAVGAAEPGSADAQAIRNLVRTIDRRIADRWADSGVEPAAPADDAEFLRRVWLDLAGKIPTAGEARDFLDDPAPDKRAGLVESLLESPAYATHWTNVWRSLLLPESRTNALDGIVATEFEAWLRTLVARNAGHDEIARALLGFSLDGDGIAVDTLPTGGRDGEPTPIAYYRTNEGKPENLAASTARVFLGIRIECAQCHDHPFGRWKRAEFWSYAAFFAGVRKEERDGKTRFRELRGHHALAVPGTQKVMQARPLGSGSGAGAAPAWDDKVSPRTILADWMTARDNLYFARAGVNLLWTQLFGTGLVDPADDHGEGNRAGHPELLDELADEFARHGYDPKRMLRALAASRAYQLSSNAAGMRQTDPRLFSRMAVKALAPEQLYDSLFQATGEENDDLDEGLFGMAGPRFEFLQKFSRRDAERTEVQTSIPQALAMMNGRIVSEAIRPERGILGAVVEAPFLDTPGKVETLFLATLSRRPRPEEYLRVFEYLERRAGKPAAPAQPGFRRGVMRILFRRQNGKWDYAFGDVFWALLNSPEFLFNH